MTASPPMWTIGKSQSNLYFSIIDLGTNFNMTLAPGPGGTFFFLKIFINCYFIAYTPFSRLTLNKSSE